MSTAEDIYDNMQMVRHFIEQCLVHYMNQKEVKDVLKREQNIDPIFTESVWQLLEEHNPEFFKSYHLRLMLKEQITKFNNLLTKQAELLCQTDPNRASYQPMFNVSHMPPMAHNNGSRNVSDTGTFRKMENKHVSVPRVPVSGYNNGGQSTQSGMQRGVDGSTTYSRRIEVPSHNSNNGMREIAVKREPGNVGHSRIGYQGGSTVRGPHPANSAMVPNLSEEVSARFTSPPSEHDTSSSELYRLMIEAIAQADMEADFANKSGPSNLYRRM